MVHAWTWGADQEDLKFGNQPGLQRESQASQHGREEGKKKKQTGHGRL